MTMTEFRYDREFGRGTLLGDKGDNFFSKPLDQQVLEIGWSHACPVVDKVVKEYGPEWTLKISEAVSKQDANPRAVLAHTLSKNILLEEGCRSIFGEIKRRIDKSAPNLRETYNSMLPAQREAEDIINF